MTLDRPEAKMLLLCARTRRDSERDAQIKALLFKELDWRRLLRMARTHGMMPLLYWHLSKTCPEAIPKDTLHHLQDHFYKNTHRNLFVTGELLSVLNLFEAQGISAIPYKGPTLAAVAYGNLALREFADLDILVRKQDVQRAKELLTSAGYRLEDRLTRAQEAALLGYTHERAFRRDGKSLVELHWGVVQRHFSFPLDPERLWERLERVSLGGATVPTLSPENLVLILCVHGSKHLWERLGWICDVAQLMNARKEMDWERVTEQAAALGGERMLFLGLYLAIDLLGVALPEEVLRKVEADPVVETLAREVHERLFWEAKAPPEVFKEIPFSPFHLKMRERLRDKIRYLVRAATTSTVRDWTFLPLPSYLFPLYYVVRPVRLTRKYGRRLLGRLL